jgi:hypothetical protein
MVLILLLAGDGFLRSNLTKKFWGAGARVLAVLRAFLRGVLKIVCFLMVICWWICGDCVVDRGAKMVLIWTLRIFHFF